MTAQGSLPPTHPNILDETSVQVHLAHVFNQKSGYNLIIRFNLHQIIEIQHLLGNFLKLRNMIFDCLCPIIMESVEG